MKKNTKAKIEKKMQKVRCLGEGCFGSVHLMRLKEKDGTFKHYAMKSSKAWAYSNLAKEFRVLSKLRGCPGVIQCKSESLMKTYNYDGDEIFSLLLEYAEGGTLGDLMEKYPGKILPDHQIRNFAEMILRGLQAIHEKGYVHCDLKPENILVFNRVVEQDGVMSLIDEVKIADFGLTKEPKERRKDWWSPSSPFRGTPLYMSPESVKSGRIGSFLDIWSLGCIILKMYTGQSLWPYETVQEIRVALENRMTPEIPEHLPLFVKDFLQMCFILDPKYRLTASQLLRHPLFKENLDEPERNVAIKNKMDKETEEGSEKQHSLVKIIPPKEESPPKNMVLRFKYTPSKPKIVFKYTPPKPKIVFKYAPSKPKIVFKYTPPKDSEVQTERRVPLGFGVK